MPQFACIFVIFLPGNRSATTKVAKAARYANADEYIAWDDVSAGLAVQYIKTQTMEQDEAARKREGPGEIVGRVSEDF